MGYKRHLAIASMITLLMLVASVALADPAPGAAEIYKAKCASCHGADGSGQTPVGKSLKARDLRSEEVQKQTDADLRRRKQKAESRKQKCFPAFCLLPSATSADRSRKRGGEDPRSHPRRARGQDCTSCC